MTLRRTITFVLALATLAALVGCNGPGSLIAQRATLYADTRTAERDGFTNKSPQWAYNREKVTFDFAPDLAYTDYAVFYWPGGHVDLLQRVDLIQSYFRGVAQFKAGPQPVHNVVRCEAYAIVDRPDWYYDRDEKRWVHHPFANDGRDMKVGQAEMEIICYRVDMAFDVNARGRKLTDAELRIFRSDGTATAIGRGTGDDSLRVIGPDAAGVYHATYTPTAEQVNRTGTTQAELTASFADGTQETLTRTFDTP